MGFGRELREPVTQMAPCGPMRDALSFHGLHQRGLTPGLVLSLGYGPQWTALSVLRK